MRRSWGGALGMLGMLAVAPALAAGPAPLAEVWPWTARRLSDGRVEYAYDLTGLKAGVSQSRAAGELDAEWVKSLAGKLPDTARVVVDLSGAAFSLDVSSEPERGEPVPSFATARSGERARGGPLEERPGPRLLPGLHPDVARVLPSVDMLAWKAGWPTPRCCPRWSRPRTRGGWAGRSASAPSGRRWRSARSRA